MDGNYQKNSASDTRHKLGLAPAYQESKANKFKPDEGYEEYKYSLEECQKPQNG